MNKDKLIQSLMNGTYEPQPVRGVQIPKPDGSKRQLGIPTVVDRIIQQAILQVLQPYFETTFSNNSYGFRPGRSAHHAVKQASAIVKSGYCFVVDIDLEKFFDKVNHDRLMSKLAFHIKDKRLLRLIRAFLRAGLMNNGVIMNREEGTPQGSPLSPLLSNIVLTELDEELEKRGHKHVRYADDCNIYVSSLLSAERVLNSITNWIEDKLKLKVNKKKSAGTEVSERKFLGYQILGDGWLRIAAQSMQKFRKKFVSLTKRRTPMSLSAMIVRITPLLRGWFQYFRLTGTKGEFRDLDGWIRRRLRSFRLHQCKRFKTKVKFLIELGIPLYQACRLAKSGKGKWRLSRTPQMQQAMNKSWFEAQGLISFTRLFQELKV
jgi:RNA-directed DNA polymerase